MGRPEEHFTYYRGWPSRVLRPVKRSLGRLIFAGKKYRCNICKGNFSRMLGGDTCPGCRSATRHRMLWHYLAPKLEQTSDTPSVLHFAPEYCVERALRSMKHVHYVSCDLFEPEAMLKLDITNISLPDNSQDIVLCSHVLEHVPDDGAAMSELRRVTKNDGGIVLIQVPLDDSSQQTYEDWAITEPLQRKQAFGQHDHVRVYGMDIVDRLQAAGFDVEVVRPWRDLQPSDREQLCVWDDYLFVCRPSVPNTCNCEH